MTVRLWPLLLFSCMCSIACGGGQTRGHPLDRSWDDEDGTELESFVKSWQVVRPPPVVEAAIGVIDRTTLVGRALPDGKRWTYTHELESRPLLTGTVVVGLGDGELFALDARTGEELWTRKALGRLRGASDDGATTLVSIASLSMQRSIVLAIGRNGQVARQIYERAVIGAPTVLDSFAFLPYGEDLVLIFDLLEGTEAARVISKMPVTRSFIVGKEVYFGERGALRFDDQVVKARQGGGTYLELPDRELPGNPQWMVDGATAMPLAATRYDSVRYYAQPKVTKTSTRIDRYALSYFDLAVGLSAPEGATRWVHVANAPFLGGDIGDQTLVLCDAGGDVRWLDLETGSVLMRRTLGEAVIACAVQSERPRPGDTPPNPAKLTEQLALAIDTAGRELIPAQLVLLDDLDAVKTDEATRALMRLAQPRAEDTWDRKPIRRRAAELLASRRKGLAALLDALYDGRLDLPLRPMIDALLASQHPGAARALAWRLQDPRWSREALTRIATALEEVATADELSLLTVFFTRIRCTQPDLERAVVAIARALVRLGRADLVRKVVSEACDNDAMKERLGATADSAR
jgi:outer membrane protein assembly factor BamB